MNYKKVQVLHEFDPTHFYPSVIIIPPLYHLSYNCAVNKDLLNVIHEEVKVYFTGMNF